MTVRNLDSNGDKTVKVPEPGKQVKPRVRVGGDKFKKGESGILIQRGKKIVPIEELEPEHKVK